MGFSISVRRPRRWFLSVLAALTVVAVTPLAAQAAPKLVNLVFTSATCTSVTSDTNAVPPPTVFETVLNCVVSANTTANPVTGTTTGAATVAIHIQQAGGSILPSPSLPNPCDTSTTVEVTVAYADNFGTVEFDTTMPYASGPSFTCVTNYAGTGTTVNPTGTVAYAALDEVCVFQAIGSDFIGQSQGDLVDMAADNQRSATPCSPSN
jgi:hypothetical protein